MSGTGGLTDLEDRLLVLRDQVDSLNNQLDKGDVVRFNPNQPRAKDGKWTDGPGGGSAADATPLHTPKTFYLEDHWGGDTELPDIKTEAEAEAYAESEHGGYVIMRGRTRNRDMILTDAGREDGKLYWMNREKLEHLESFSLVDDDSLHFDKGFNPNQPRDKDGQWSGTGGGGVSAPAIIKPKWGFSDFEMARIGPAAIKEYNELVGIRPVDFRRQFLGPASDTSSLDISSGVGGSMGIVSMLSKGSTGIGTMVRSLFNDDGRKVASHDSFELFRGKQGFGHAKDILGSQVKLWQNIGVDQVNLEANVDIGGYAWAKYGFLPGNNMWKDLSRQVGNRIVEAGYKGMVDATSMRLFDKVIKNPDPRAIWALADMTSPINYNPVGHKLVGVYNPKLNTLGKYALANTHWLGSLDLKHPEQMGRFNAYIKTR